MTQQSKQIRGANDGRKGKQTNVTKGGGAASTLEASKGENGDQGSLTLSVTWATLAAVAAKDKSVLCTLVEPDVGHNFTLFQDGTNIIDSHQYILLDNQSTSHMFKDRALLTNIKPAPYSIAIHITVGTSHANKIGYIQNFLDPVWICKSGIANILSFAKVRTAGCNIGYD